MQTQNSTHHHSGHSDSSLINSLTECALACERCMAACLEEKDVTPMAHCIELNRDCAQICLLGAQLLLRDSKVAHQYLLVCEQACRLCAEECSLHDHEHCKACARECRSCEQACHEHHGEINLA